MTETKGEQMSLYLHIFKQVVHSDIYKKNILYGKPRRGHAEGTVKAHIDELEQNLALIVAKLGGFDNVDYIKLKILIHVHDTFKVDAKQDSPILDPQSHASLARAFLAPFTIDEDLLNMVQYHDIGYAVYRKFKEKGKLDEERLKAALDKMQNLDLFVIFCIIDACTASKGREMIRWFVDYVEKHYTLKHASSNLILPGEETPEGEW
jgi:hypothetical protein